MSPPALQKGRMAEWMCRSDKKCREKPTQDVPVVINLSVTKPELRWVIKHSGVKNCPQFGTAVQALFGRRRGVFSFYLRDLFCTIEK